MLRQACSNLEMAVTRFEELLALDDADKRQQEIEKFWHDNPYLSYHYFNKNLLSAVEIFSVFSKIILVSAHLAIIFWINSSSLRNCIWGRKNDEKNLSADQLSAFLEKHKHHFLYKAFIGNQTRTSLALNKDRLIAAHTLQSRTPIAIRPKMSPEEQWLNLRQHFFHLLSMNLPNSTPILQLWSANPSLSAYYTDKLLVANKIFRPHPFEIIQLFHMCIFRKIEKIWVPLWTAHAFIRDNVYKLVTTETTEREHQYMLDLLFNTGLTYQSFFQMILPSITRTTLLEDLLSRINNFFKENPNDYYHEWQQSIQSRLAILKGPSTSQPLPTPAEDLIIPANNTTASLFRSLKRHQEEEETTKPETPIEPPAKRRRLEDKPASNETSLDLDDLTYEDFSQLITSLDIADLKEELGNLWPLLQHDDAPAPSLKRKPF